MSTPLTAPQLTRALPSIKLSAGIPQMTPEPACILGLSQLCCKTDASCGRLLHRHVSAIDVGAAKILAETATVAIGTNAKCRDIRYTSVIE
jgi:hypothetical protein